MERERGRERDGERRRKRGYKWMSEPFDDTSGHRGVWRTREVTGIRYV
jgi:hypothetical protein